MATDEVVGSCPVEVEGILINRPLVPVFVDAKNQLLLTPRWQQHTGVCGIEGKHSRC